MSAKLFRLFAGSLRQNLPRYSLPGNQLRFVTAMDVASTPITEVKEAENIVQSKEVTRFKKRFKRRQWEDGGRKNDGESDAKKACDKPVERIKRKKMAMLLGYCGLDYYGMQRNPGVPTIEEDLMKALWDAKYITEEDFNNQQNAQFQRSSRTDKGVSAARQVVSLKLPLEVNIEEINKRLPESIRVFGVKRVTNKFNSKVKCNARSYSYTLPTYVFEPSINTEEERKKYRIPQEKLDQITKVLGEYKGTRSYHNFTEKKHYQDPSASRYMMGFSIDKVFVESHMEFAVLVVKGQSFMLHQIRKMVGLTVAVVRGHADAAILHKAFGKDKVMIPTAPGLGLLLDMVHYDRYDNKFKESHASLTWQEEEATVQAFKHKYIYPVIVTGETEGNSMGMWLEKLANHSYEPSDDAPTDKEEIAGDDDDDDDAGDDDANDDSTGNDERTGDSTGNEDRTGDSTGNDDRTGDSTGNEDRTGVSTKNKDRTGDPTGNEDRTGDATGNEERTGVSTKNKDRTGDSTGNEGRTGDSTGIEGRTGDSTGIEGRTGDSTGNEERTKEVSNSGQ